jgi:ComF family protein
MLTPDGRTCQSCKRESPLSAFVPATSYHEFCVSKAIHLFKYRFVQDLSTPLAELLTLALQKTELPIPELIIPIPLHQRRLRWRGFNQAALLAEYVSKNLLLADEIKYSQNILIRSRYTYPQMKIKDFQGRSKNISGAFFVADKNAIKNKNILLIDDVATTGSTIFECASVLKAAGAGEIYATVIARQEVKRRTKT